MTSFRSRLVSTAPCLVWAFVVGCESGGGFRGATLTHDEGASGNVTGGSGGMNSGGMNPGGAGTGGASAGDAGSAGVTAGAGAGAGGEMVGAGQAGIAGATAGSLGTGGVAGDASGGVSGSSIVAGGGAGGEAGSGTMGGAGAAGIAGEGGTAGTAVAGSSGVSGGMSGAASGGTAGASGSGGSAGSGGPLKICAERCNTDVDCQIFGVEQGYRCNPSTHRCETFAEPCRSSLECLPNASFWIFACTTDADCFFFSDDLCVDVAGVGRCARLAPSADGCAEPNADEVTLPRFGAKGSVLVCANATRTCSEGECVPGCRSDTDCVPSRNGSVCDLDTHLCRCVGDDDCGGLGVSHCNTASGRCECSDARDCEEVPNANACSAGRCGCAAVSACNVERTFSGTSYVCE